MQPKSRAQTHDSARPLCPCSVACLSHAGHTPVRSWANQASREPATTAHDCSGPEKLLAPHSRAPQPPRQVVRNTALNCSRHNGGRVATPPPSHIPASDAAPLHASPPLLHALYPATCHPWPCTRATHGPHVDPICCALAQRPIAGARHPGESPASWLAAAGGPGTLSAPARLSAPA